MSEKEQLIEKGENKNENEMRKNIWLFLDIITITFFATSCSSVPASFFAREYIKMGGSDSVAAVILQIHPFAIAITGWICGKIIPHTGYKTMALLGVVLESTSQIGFGLCSLTNNLTAYTALAIILRILSGVGNAAAVTTVYAIAATEFGRQSPFVLGAVESTTGVSYLLGPILGALIFKINNTMVLPMVVTGAAYFLSISRFALRYKSDPTKEKFSIIKFSVVLQLLSHVAVQGPLFVLLSITGMFSYMVVFLTVYVKDIGMDVLQAGILLGIMAGAYMIGSLLVGKLLTVHSHLSPICMILGCLAYAVNYYCFTQKIIWVVYFGSILTGIFDSTSIISVFAFSLDYVKNLKMDLTLEERTSCLAGLWMSINNLGKLPFSAIGGAVISATSIIQANFGIMIFCYCLTFFTFSFHFYLYLKQKRSPRTC